MHSTLRNHLWQSHLGEQAAEVALKRIDLLTPLQPIEFLVPGLLPFGYVSFVGAREGARKTTLFAALAWQMTRPSGTGNFLGRPIASGRVIYLNTDAADGQARPVRHWLEQHQVAFPDVQMSGLSVYQTTGADLCEQELEKLLGIAVQTQARCLIIDSFMGAFPGVNSNRLDHVIDTMLKLRNVAAQTGMAVILSDHLPKPVAGEKEGARGIMGSVGKVAQARAVHLLSSVTTQESRDREILRWEVRKASFSQSGYAFGLEVKSTFDEAGRTGIEIQPYDLPGEHSYHTRSDRAVASLKEHLEGHPDTEVSHAKLLDLAMSKGDLRERAAQDAVRKVLAQLGTQLEVMQLAGRGAPRAYRYRHPSPGVLDDTHVTPEELSAEII